jgi:NAD-dependent dihydropyrimidine dehydrogenase PreA subunit
MIELVSASRCIGCGACVRACPDNVFDSGPGGVPLIARREDCQTCFLCELYCPADALYVSPLKDERETVNENHLAASGHLGAYRRALGWRKITAAGATGDLSYKLDEPDGTPE